MGFIIKDRLRLLLLTAMVLGGTGGVHAQPTETETRDTEQAHVDFAVTTEAAVGTGDFTAYQLVSNRYHSLATRPNTALLRTAVTAEQPLGSAFALSGAVDVIGSVHADHRLYLQQCYARLSWKDWFFLEAGSRELKPALRDVELSSGVFINGCNSKPIPQVHIGTQGFWTVPFTRGWLQIDADFGYGKFMDSQYREDRFRQTNGTTSPFSGVNKGYATGSYYHQKHLYFRSNPEKRFFVVAGMDHAVQLAGTNYLVVNGQLVEKQKSANLKALWNVVLPLGDSHYYENESMEDWVYGNHIGSMTVQIGWNINKQHLVQAYHDRIFEDGSGMRLGNGWDGLWGLQYTNKATGRQYVRGAVVEYYQTTNQSGPLHWDAGDYPEPARSQITELVVGNDDYYNHLYYFGYSHYGMTPGNPLITSPIYNKDGYHMYRDNRVKAWHLAVEGELTDRLAYLVKGSYREGWGTYNVPLLHKHHSFDGLLEGRYHCGPWKLGAAYGFDVGNIYGDCSTLYIKIGYHGKIL